MKRHRSVVDVESGMSYLLGMLSSTAAGTETPAELDDAFEFVLGSVKNAERYLKQLNMYEQVKSAIENGRGLAKTGQYLEADDLILGVARVLYEISGTNDALRASYGGHRTDQSKH